MAAEGLRDDLLGIWSGLSSLGLGIIGTAAAMQRRGHGSDDGCVHDDFLHSWGKYGERLFH